MTQEKPNNSGAWQEVFTKIQGSKEAQLERLGHDLQKLKDLSPEKDKTTLAPLREQIRERLCTLVNDQLITPRLMGQVLSLEGLEGMRQEGEIINAVRTALADLMINKSDKAEAVAQANALMKECLFTKEEIEAAALESIQFYFDQEKINLEDAETIRKNFGIDPQKIHETFKDYFGEILEAYPSSDSMEFSDIVQWIPEGLVRQEGLERLKDALYDSNYNRRWLDAKEFVRKYDLGEAHCGAAFDAFFGDRKWGEYLEGLPHSLSTKPKQWVKDELAGLEEFEQVLSSLGINAANSACLALFQKIMNFYREWVKPHAQLENALGHVETLEKAIKGFGLSSAAKPLAQLRKILEGHRKRLKS